MTGYTYPAGTVVTHLSAPFGVLIRDRDGHWTDPRDGVAWGNQTDESVYAAVERVRSHAIAFQPGEVGKPPVVPAPGDVRDAVIDAIEETFLPQLGTAAISHCAVEDVYAGLSAMRERFQTAEWKDGER